MTKTDRKQAVILLGTPRKAGNTAMALQPIEASLVRRGWKIAKADLYRMEFKGCAHCDHCKRFVKEPACKLQDDLRPVLDAIARAQLLVVASPVYCWSVSGCMSAALDRFYCLFKNGRSLLQGKKMLGLFTAEGDVFDGMDLCVEMLKRLCEYGQIEYLGTVAGSLCATPAATRRRHDIQKAGEDLLAQL